MQFEGTITFIWPIETVGNNWLQKRTFVVEEVSDKEWKQSLAVDLLKDKVDLTNHHDVGDVVTVYFKSRANKSQKNNKYYNAIQAYMIEGSKTKSKHDSDVDNILPF